MKPVVVNPNITFTQLVDELDKVSDTEASQLIVDQLLAKLQRKHHRISDNNTQSIETAVGMAVGDMVEHLLTPGNLKYREVLIGLIRCFKGSWKRF